MSDGTYRALAWLLVLLFCVATWVALVEVGRWLAPVISAL